MNDLPEGFQVEQLGEDGLPPGFRVESLGGEPSPVAKYGKSAFNALKMASQYTNPFQAAAGYQMGQHPKETAQALGEHYSKYLTPAGWKDLAINQPFETAVEVGGLLAGGKPAVGRLPTPKGPSLIPTGAERLARGGLQMKIAKLDPAKVPAEMLAGPMQRFRERLAADAIELDPQFVKPELMNRVRRLDEAYKPTPRSPMANLTGVEPAAKPPVTLAELHGHKKKLNEFINTGGGKTEGKINEQGHIAIALRKTVDEMIENHPMSPAFKTGSRDYSLGKQSEAFDEIKRQASLTAQWRNGNEVAALQNATAEFLKAKKNKYAFTPEIRRKLEAFSRDNRGRLLAAFGSKTVSGNAAGRMVESFFGAPGAMILPGMAAREARTQRLMEAWDRISEEIRAGGSID